jgi:uncharacterized protein YkwD
MQPLLRPLLALVALAVVAAASSAASTPVVESVVVDGDTVAGRQGRFLARSADPAAPVSGISLSFEGQTLGSSACRAARGRGRGGRRRGGPFAAGSRVVLAAPHRFGAPSTSDGALRIDSGGCGRVTGAVVQPFSATVTEPGQPTQPLELGEPVQLFDGPRVDPSDIPALVGLPPLAPFADPLTPTAAASCPGARSSGLRSASARRVARETLLCLVNRQRRSRGLAPLGVNRRLARAAHAHARAMIRGRFFSHYGKNPPGRTLISRLRRSNYLPARRFLVGENLAYATGGRSSPAAIVSSWMQSSPHRANILTPKFREIGIAIEYGSPAASTRGVTYATNFGHRR